MAISRRPIKYIRLSAKEQEVMMQAAERLREQVENSPFNHGIVVIERKGKSWQVYATTPTLFID